MVSGGVLNLNTFHCSCLKHVNVMSGYLSLRYLLGKTKAKRDRKSQSTPMTLVYNKCFVLDFEFNILLVTLVHLSFHKSILNVNEQEK